MIGPVTLQLIFVFSGALLVGTDGACDLCSGLRQGQFKEFCARALGRKLVRNYIRECQSLGDDSHKVLKHLDKVERKCAALKIHIQISLPECAVVTAATTPSTNLAKNTSCECVDLVIMMDSSNTMGQTAFNEMKIHLSTLVGSLDIGELETHVAVISYSDGLYVQIDLSYNKTKIIEQIMDTKFQASSLRTDFAITKFKIIISRRRSSRRVCAAIGLLTSSGKSTDWRKTAQEAKKMYHAHPGIRLIVLGIQSSVSNNDHLLEQWRTLATGLQDKNLVLVTQLSELNDTLAASLVNRICDNCIAPTECEQWIVTGTVATDLGDEYFGVYERVTITCNGHQVFRHISGNWWLSALEFTSLYPPMTYWCILGTNPSNFECRDPTTLIAVLVVEQDIPRSFTSWIEYTATDSNIVVECFNLKINT